MIDGDLASYQHAQQMRIERKTVEMEKRMGNIARDIQKNKTTIIQMIKQQLEQVENQILITRDTMKGLNITHTAALEFLNGKKQGYLDILELILKRN